MSRTAEAAATQRTQAPHSLHARQLSQPPQHYAERRINNARRIQRKNRGENQPRSRENPAVPRQPDGRRSNAQRRQIRLDRPSPARHHKDRRDLRPRPGHAPYRLHSALQRHQRQRSPAPAQGVDARRPEIPSRHRAGCVGSHLLHTLQPRLLPTTTYRPE